MTRETVTYLLRFQVSGVGGQGFKGSGFRGSGFNEKIHSGNPERGTVNV